MHVCFNDALLLLCHSIDTDEFIKLLKHITNDCLSTETKTVEKHLYFKNTLLHSNIWAMPSTKRNSGMNDDYKQLHVQVSDTKNDTLDSNSSIFDQLENEVILAQLNKQREYIRSNMIELELNYSKQFDRLRSNIKQISASLTSTISQNKLENKYLFGDDFMNKNGILSDYLIKDMPFDGVNGFKRNDEYDLNGYLTKLLIASHNINPIFQKECKNYFDNTFNKQHGIKCKNSEAPVKTKERSMMKAKIDYRNKQWPHSSNILDTVRCSVTFDNIDQFLKGFNIFFHQFNMPDGKISVSNNQNEKCLKGIVRIKKDFSSLELDRKKKKMDIIIVMLSVIC